MLCADHLEAHARDIGHDGESESSVLLMRAQEAVAVYAFEAAVELMRQYYDHHTQDMVQYSRWCERQAKEVDK
jgi:hypothetical protein